ncbi:MAG: AMP-binding protein [Polyangiaceae bacterium]
MSLNLGNTLRESAKRHAKNTAVVVGDTALDYATLDAYASRFAAALAKLGVTRGQHVALMLPNVPQFTIAYYAVLYLGGVVVPLNVLLRADEIHYHLDDSDAVTLVVWEGFLDQAEIAFQRSEGCHHLVVAKANPTDVTAPGGAHNLTALIAGSEPFGELTATMPDDTAVMLYTSGTTGRPKGAELTHFNMFYNAEYTSTKLMPLTAETRALTVLPLFHSFGQTVIQNGVLGSGGTLVLMPRFDAEGRSA